MSISKLKLELLKAIEARFDRFEAARDHDSELFQKTIKMDGLTKCSLMSPADHVSYLNGWNTLVLNWRSQDDAGGTLRVAINGTRLVPWLRNSTRILRHLSS